MATITAEYLNSHTFMGHFEKQARSNRELRTRLFLFVASICLAISAACELLEFLVSILSGAKGDFFLGTQGDIWDTQKDMALAFLGAVGGQLELGRWQDRQIESLRQPDNLKPAQS